MTKSKFRKGLERILAGGIFLVGSLVGGVDAGRIGIYNRSNDVTWSLMEAKHIEGATESFDTGFDSHYNEGNPNVLHIYSNILY